MERSIRAIFRSFDDCETRESDAILQGKTLFRKEKELGEYTGRWGFGGFCKYPPYRFTRGVLAKFNPDGVKEHERLLAERGAKNESLRNNGDL